MLTQKRKSESVLSEAYAIDLILLIAKNGELKAMDIMTVHKSYYYMFAVARDLELHGLLKIHETRVPRHSYTIRLTIKGEKVAEKLREAKEILGEKL
jgi:predicted transcriptional regulator